MSHPLSLATKPNLATSALNAAGHHRAPERVTDYVLRDGTQSRAPTVHPQAERHGSGGEGDVGHARGEASSHAGSVKSSHLTVRISGRGPAVLKVAGRQFVPDWFGVAV